MSWPPRTAPGSLSGCYSEMRREYGEAGRAWDEGSKGMGMMRCALAVDGGNTKTIAVVAALDGALLGVGRSGCSDIYNAVPSGEETDSAAAALAAALRATNAALEAAGAEPADLAASVFNMAGADWLEDIAFWREAMSARGYGQRVIAQNDALGALYAATPEATGVSIVAGTGVATGARAADGTIWHSSFWQDEAQGSAHPGQKLLFAVYRAALGIAPPTTLTDRVLGLLGASSVEAVLRLYHDRHHPAPVSVDRLAPLLLDEAHAGDAAALRIVRDYGEGLGDMALVAARRVGLSGSAFPLVLAGGMFRHPTTVLEDIISVRVHGAEPAAQALRSPVEPVAGVIIEALGAAGVPINQPLLDRVIAAIPAALESDRGARQGRF
jgi:N-acetylglucosamine kinase-like BadF-type ATPase